ncbi:HAD-IIB family hydrolase [Pacificibacter marinus]|uniref:HAD-IIB family hydrolase n=1 Tax=Pacificibacter marinus TaxID=658057 RepID=UPI001C06A284|nr:HAD hydrolase family protein [Pacificibacter marinus]MBU2866605.1 HAD hydrolase family protein [Pacificibacter marinus]
MTPNTATKLIVFTDLDGTLLDHDSYSWSPAIPALEMMKTLGVPLVLASSKTAYELVVLRKELGFEHCPAIVENGAGLLPAFKEPDQNAAQHTQILTALSDLPPALRVQYEGFSDWSDAECAEKTGLPLAQARSARQRQFSEPGLWSGTQDELQDFETKLAKKGIFARQGGRYLTLSFGATKADWMSKILDGFNPKPFTMALGDAPNDVEMIVEADFGVIINNTHGAGIPRQSDTAEASIVRTTQSGPKGWNIEVQARLKQLYVEEE